MKDFTLVSNGILFDKELSAMQFRILCALQSYDFQDKDGARKGQVWPSIRELAERLGVHVNTVQRCVCALQKRGYLTKGEERAKNGKWTHNVYTFSHAHCSVYGEASRAQSSVAAVHIPVCEPHTSQCVLNILSKNTKQADEERERDNTHTQRATTSSSLKQSDAVEIYEELSDRRCGRLQRDAIDAAVDDPQRWREVVEQWMLRGHNEGNVAGMLDVYENGWRDENGWRNEYGDDDATSD